MTQLKMQLRQKMEGHAPLTSKLANGVNSIFPAVRSGQPYEATAQTATPFVVLRMDEVDGIDPPSVQRHGFSIFIYDSVGNDYWAIDRIATVLHELFEGESQFSFDSGEKLQDVRTEWEHTSPESYDDGYQKAMRFLRFGIW